MPKKLVPRRDRFRMLRPALYLLVLIAPGFLLADLHFGLGLPFMGLAAYDIYGMDNDEVMRLVATIAAMREPIDWLSPLSISGLNTPDGSSLVYTDSIPLLTLPLRVIYQTTGLWLDPAVSLNLFALLSLVLTPIGGAVVAWAMGARPLLSLGAGWVVAWLAPLVWFAGQHQQSLLAWVVVAVAVAMAVRVERGFSFPRYGALIPILAWWIHPYHGAMSSAALFAAAIGAWWVGRSRVSLSLLIASIVPALTILAAGGVSLTTEMRPGGFVDAPGPRMYLDPRIVGLPLFSDRDTEFNWGLIIPIAAIIGGRHLYRSAPRLALLAIVSAWVATGVTGTGGLVPMWLYDLTPFVDTFRYLDRFALVTALIVVGGAATAISAWTQRTRRQIERRRRELVAVAGAAFLLGSQIVSLSGIPWMLSAYAVYPSHNSQAMTADRALLEAHDRLYPTPFRPCRPIDGLTATDRRLNAAEQYFNLLAADLRIPSTSVMSARYPSRDCAQPTPMAPGDLVLILGSSIAAPEGMGCVTSSLRIVIGDLPARLCSDNDAALTTYEARIQSIEAGAQPPP